MTDRELLYVKTIAEKKSFSNAAKALFMTQPSLSQCVANIEKDLGSPLFLRSTKGLVLTYAGERYYQTACEILNIYDDMTQEISEIGELKRGRVKLGITSYLSSLLLPHVLPEFCSRYPGITVSLQERNSREIESMLSDRQVDVALLHTFEGLEEAQTAALNFMPLRTEPFVIAMSPGNPLGQHSIPGTSPLGLPELDLVYLEGQPFIMGNPEQRVRQVTDYFMGKAGFTPTISLTTRNFDTARMLASKGMGVTIVPLKFVRTFTYEADTEYYAIPAKYKAEWTLSVATPKNFYLSKASKVFIDLCSKILETQTE